MNAMDEMDEQARHWYQDHVDMPEDVQRLCDAPPDEDRVKFAPWVGENYHKGFRLGDQGPRMKLLILGESHYDAWDHWAFTRDVVMRQWGQGSCRMRRPRLMNDFFPRVEQLVMGKQGREEECEIKEFYGQIAFYNYVRESMSTGSKRPSGKQFASSHSAFLRVLGMLTPDVVLVLGFELWNRLPNYSEKYENGFKRIDSNQNLCHIGTNQLDLWEVNVPKGPIAFRVPHPSPRNTRYYGVGAKDESWMCWTKKGFEAAMAFRLERS